MTPSTRAVVGNPLTSNWNATPFETTLDRFKTETEHRNGHQRSFEGRVNGSSDFLDLNKVKLRFLKDKDQEDSARRSDRGRLLRTQVKSVQSGVETMSPAEALTVSYSTGYSSGVMSKSQRPNTAVATNLSDYENPQGYVTPGDYDTSTCFTSRHPTRCSTAWSLASGTRTTSAKQPCCRIPDSRVGVKGPNSGNGSRRIDSGNDSRVPGSDKYQRTCCNELMNVITIDDGVVSTTSNDDGQ